VSSYVKKWKRGEFSVNISYPSFIDPIGIKSLDTESMLLNSGRKSMQVGLMVRYDSCVHFDNCF